MRGRIKRPLRREMHAMRMVSLLRPASAPRAGDWSRQRPPLAGSPRVQFLGVAPEADTNEINRAVTKLRYANRLNPDMLRKIEQAQSQMFLDSLNKRIKVRARKSMAAAMSN
jgi:hypothetical protein